MVSRDQDNEQGKSTILVTPQVSARSRSLREENFLTTPSQLVLIPPAAGSQDWSFREARAGDAMLVLTGGDVASTDALVEQLRTIIDELNERQQNRPIPVPF